MMTKIIRSDMTKDKLASAQGQEPDPVAFDNLLHDLLFYFESPMHEFSAEQEQRLTARLRYAVKHAPPPPAKQEPVAARYRYTPNGKWYLCEVPAPEDMNDGMKCEIQMLYASPLPDAALEKDESSTRYLLMKALDHLEGLPDPEHVAEFIALARAAMKEKP